MTQNTVFSDVLFAAQKIPIEKIMPLTPWNQKLRGWKRFTSNFH